MASNAKPSFWETVGFVFRVAFRIAPASIPIAAFFAAPLTVAVVVAKAVSERLAAIAPGVLGIPMQALAGALPVFIVVAGSLVLTFAVVYPLVAGALAWTGATAASGGRPTFGGAMTRLADRGPAALGAFVLGSLAAAAAPSALMMLAMMAGLALGGWAAVLFALLAVVSVVYPAFVLVVRFSLAPAVAMAEDVGATRALARSSGLVRGAFWWVTGILLVVAVVAALLSAAIASPFAAAGSEGVAGLVGSAAGQILGTLASTWLAGAAAGVLYVVLALRA